MRTFKLFVAAMSVSAVVSGPALAGDLINAGLIEQTVDLRGSIELDQRFTVGSVQGANVVGASGDVINAGEIRQTLNAEDAELDQRFTVGSTQCLNCVVAGNPALGF